VLVAQLGQQPDDAVRGDLERVGVEDLRADVAVQSDQAQPRRAEHAAHRLRGVPAGQREAELLVLVRGGDVLVGVRLDADRHAHQHVLHGALVASDPVQPDDLVERVQHDRADSDRHPRGELGGRFVVAVQGDPLGREVRAQRDLELAATAHVQRQPLLGDPSGHLDGQERLRRVVHEGRVAERRRVLGAASPEVCLVHDEQRRAVPNRQIPDVDPGEPHEPVAVTPGVARPDGGQQLVQLVRSGRSGPSGVARRKDVGVQWSSGMRPHRAPPTRHAWKDAFQTLSVMKDAFLAWNMGATSALGH
jgi:hypothetical protein